MADAPHFPALPLSATEDEDTVVHRPVVEADIAKGAVTPSRLDRAYLRKYTRLGGTYGLLEGGSRPGTLVFRNPDNPSGAELLKLVNRDNEIFTVERDSGANDNNDAGTKVLWITAADDVLHSIGDIEANGLVRVGGSTGPELREVGGRAELAHDDAIELMPFDVRHVLLSQSDLVVYQEDGGTPVFNVDIANRKLEARDGSMSAGVEIFPRGTLLHIGSTRRDTSDPVISSVDGFVADATHTVNLDYSGQPVKVLAWGHAHFGGVDPGGQPRVRLEVAGAFNQFPAQVYHRIHDIPSLSHRHSTSIGQSSTTTTDAHSHGWPDGGLSFNSDFRDPDPGNTSPDDGALTVPGFVERTFTPSGSSFDVIIKVRYDPDGGGSATVSYSELTVMVLRG